MGFEEQNPTWLEEASVRLGHQNPLSPFRWAPADGPLRMSEIISERALRRLDYYNDFLRPAHIRDRLRVWLWRSARPRPASHSSVPTPGSLIGTRR